MTNNDETPKQTAEMAAICSFCPGTGKYICGRAMPIQEAGEYLDQSWRAWDRGEMPHTDRPFLVISSTPAWGLFLNAANRWRYHRTP